MSLSHDTDVHRNYDESLSHLFLRNVRLLITDVSLLANSIMEDSCIDYFLVLSYVIFLPQFR